jgi:hypothetical protein
MKFGLSRQIFEKLPNIKFHENSFGGNRAVLCRRTDRQILMRLVVAFHNFDIVLKKTCNVNPSSATFSVIFLQFSEYKNVFLLTNTLKSFD